MNRKVLVGNKNEYFNAKRVIMNFINIHKTRDQRIK